MYQQAHPLDRSYAKALQLINARTDLAWKYLKEGKRDKATATIMLLRDVADDFLRKLESKNAAKSAPAKKTAEKKPAPKKKV